MTSTLQSRARAAAERLAVRLGYDEDSMASGYVTGAEYEAPRIRREAMLEAAKLVCWQCGRGQTEVRNTGDGFGAGDWEHVYTNPPAEMVPCQASDIHNEIARLRATLEQNGGKVG